MPEPYVLAILFLDAVLLLFLFERLCAALRAGVDCCRSSYSTREFLGNNYLCASARQIFVLLLPFYAMTLVVTDVSRIGFGWTLLALVALTLFRQLSGRLIGWLSGHDGTFQSLDRVNDAVCVLGIFASLPVFVLGWLTPEIPHWLLWGALSLIALVVAVVYVLRGTQIILSTQFPIYYWVLYLCALEFLPICVVANILINGN